MTLREIWEARDLTTDIARLDNSETYVSLAHDTWQLAADAAELSEAERASALWSIASA